MRRNSNLDFRGIANQSRTYVVVVFGLVGAFLLLRIPRLGMSTWYDEAGLLANMTQGPLPDSTGFDWLQYAPPGYMALGNIAFQQLGDGALIALRLTSLVAGFITLAAVEHVGRTVGHRFTGIIAGSWIVFSPILIEYQTLAKPYAVDLALSAVFIVAALKKNRAPLVILALIGPAISFGFGLFVIIAVTVISMRGRRLPSRFLVTIAALAAVSTTASYLVGDPVSRAAIQEANSGSLRSGLGQVVYGWPILDSGFFPLSALLIPFAWGPVILILMGLGLYTFLMLRRATPAKSYVVLGVFLLLAIAAVGGVSLTTRAFLPAFACLVIWFIAGFVEAFRGSSHFWRMAAASIGIGALVTSASLFSLSERLTFDEGRISSRIEATSGRVFVDFGLAPGLQWIQASRQLTPRISSDLLVEVDGVLLSCRGSSLRAGDLIVVPADSIAGIRRSSPVNLVEVTGSIGLLAVDGEFTTGRADEPSLCAHPLRNPNRTWAETSVLP